MKKSKIIATLGPASMDFDSIKILAQSGVDVFRLNFSFGSYEEHLKVISYIRDVSVNINKSLAILQDLQGPKIRVGKLKKPVLLEQGMTVILYGGTDHDIHTRIPTTYSNIASDTETGKTILLADGKIILEVLSTDETTKEVTCTVINGGTVLTGKGIILPYTDISLPALTEKDQEDAIFGLKAGVDYIGLSFVRKPDDIKKLKNLMNDLKIQIPIISKIEKPEALENIDAILELTDGIMVARGDLAVEISFSKVPVIQKELIHKANIMGKFTIVATEMLSSMVDNPRPTRAEASDVANAVLDGADALMLSNETAMGKFPLKAVCAMADIITDTEDSILNDNYRISLNMPKVHSLTQAVCEAASHLSYNLNEKAIAIITHSGHSVHVMSKYRPQSNIFAATFSKKIYYRMALFYNVYPILLKESIPSQTSLTLEEFQNYLNENNLVDTDDRLICLTGNISPKGWTVNTITVQN
jgi:pyruvate kinase